MSINVTIDTIAQGASGERISEAFKRITENILDFNTDHKKKRVLTIKVEMTPNEKRDQVAIDVLVEPKLVPQKQVESTFLVGKDANGQIVMNELKSSMPGQTYIDDDGSNVSLKDDVGNVVEVYNVDNNGVIEFKKATK